MEYIFNQIKLAVKQAVIKASKLYGYSLPEELNLELDLISEQKANFGDVSTNVAMVLAKQLGQKPNILAEQISAQINSDLCERISVAGAGFINMFFSEKTILIGINQARAAGIKYGLSDFGKGEKINIEYVSANPTGPLHIGHTRGAIYGEILCSLLQKSGFCITREYYINDAGSQIDKLAKSAIIRYQQIALQDSSIAIPDGCYPGDYLIATGQKIFDANGAALLGLGLDDAAAKVRNVVIEDMLNLIKEDLEKLDIKHDVFTSELEICADEKMMQIFETLRLDGHIYTGTIEKPKHLDDSDDWAEVEQELFRSTALGDDMDRPIKKQDGSWAYFAPDIAYHYDKYRRGFKKMILILGADHKGYVKRISAAVKAVSNGEAEIDVRLCELVNFLENGIPAKMSKRSGDFVSVGDVVDQCHPDILRFIMLTRKNDTVLNFDFAKAKEQSKDNPIFYIQYAHSRCCSLLRSFAARYGELINEELTESEWHSIKNSDALRNIWRHIVAYPKVISRAVTIYELHLIAFFLIEFSASVHEAWNGDMTFIDKEDVSHSAAVMKVIMAVKNVIAAALDIFNVTPMEKM